jgi:BlaI family transcriptional regulator, penicillinase repressor
MISKLTAVVVKREMSRMAKSVPSLGELEIQVLRLVWQEQPCTERTITELVKEDRAVARTTVLKTMQRLEEKGLLVREPGATGSIRYRAAVEEKRLLPSLIRRFVDRVLGGSPGALAAYLAESGDEKLSAKDLEALRSIARKIGREES